MPGSTTYITPDIKLSTYHEKFHSTDVLFNEHILVWFLSGEASIAHGDSTYSFTPGDVFLIPRNQLISVTLHAADGQPNRSVTMHLTTTRLQAFYAGRQIHTGHIPAQQIPSFQHHPLLKSLLASLLPYFDINESVPEDIASLKITEAISILRLIDKSIDGHLANYEKPGKIDLADFMEKNYTFNVSMEKFGYLTGRSLATFKRDFKKLYNTTPQKWLTKKRLALAHYLFTEKKKAPVDVYYEVGFENLSHFSFAFRKEFGYAPTALFK